MLFVSVVSISQSWAYSNWPLFVRGGGPSPFRFPFLDKRCPWNCAWYFCHNNHHNPYLNRAKSQHALSSGTLHSKTLQYCRESTVSTMGLHLTKVEETSSRTRLSVGVRGDGGGGGGGGIFIWQMCVLHRRIDISAKYNILQICCDFILKIFHTVTQNVTFYENH